MPTLNNNDVFLSTIKDGSVSILLHAGNSTTPIQAATTEIDDEPRTKVVVTPRREYVIRKVKFMSPVQESNPLASAEIALGATYPF